MAELDTKQEREIGGMQSDIRHISNAVARIEEMMIEHNKVHSDMAKSFEGRMSSVEYWITAVKWGAGVLTTFIIILFPALNKLIQNRPTQEQVAVIVKEEMDDYELTKKNN